jgi:aspartate racemase
MKSIARAKIIHGIVGGVGPMAGVKLHEKIIEFTPTDGTDQSHLCVHHISQSQYIPDRTRFLLEQLHQQQEQYSQLSNSRTTQSTNQRSNRKFDQIVPSQQGKNVCKLPNPGIGALTAVKSLIDSTTVDHKLIIGVPCNTFHSPSIWAEFENGIKNYVDEISDTKKIQVQLLHMVQETAEYIFNILQHRILLNSHDDCEDVKEMEKTIYKIGLLSTKGTRDTKIYHNALEGLNGTQAYTSTTNFACEIVCLPDHLQEKLSNAIYNKEYGIKAKSRPCVDQRVIEDMHTCCEYFINKHGCDIIILGCTELPLALPATNSYKGRKGDTNVHLVDPVEILAKTFIREHISSSEMEDGIYQRVTSFNNKYQEKK